MCLFCWPILTSYKHQKSFAIFQKKSANFKIGFKICWCLKCQMKISVFMLMTDILHIKMKNYNFSFYTHKTGQPSFTSSQAFTKSSLKSRAVTFPKEDALVLAMTQMSSQDSVTSDTQ